MGGRRNPAQRSDRAMAQQLDTSRDESSDVVNPSRLTTPGLDGLIAGSMAGEGGQLYLPCRSPRPEANVT